MCAERGRMNIVPVFLASLCFLRIYVLKYNKVPFCLFCVVVKLGKCALVVGETGAGKDTLVVGETGVGKDTSA